MKYALKAPKIVDALRGIDGAPHLALMDIEPRHRQGMLAWMDRTAAAIVSAEHFVFENVPVTVSGDGSLDLPGVTHEERSMIAEGLIPLPFATCWFEIVGATSQETMGYLLTETANGFTVDPFRFIDRIADVAKGGAVQCTAERWTVERTGSGTSDPVIQVDDPFGGGALFRSLGADAGFVVSADTMVRGEIGMIGYLLIMLSSRSTEVDVVPAPDRLNRARARKGKKAPIPAHRVVSIIPHRIAAEMRREAGAEGDRVLRSTPRLHWRRSHIRMRDGKRIVVVRHLVGYKAADGREMVTHEYRVRL